MRVRGAVAALTSAALLIGAAHALATPVAPNAAMRKGIRDWVRSATHGGKAVGLHVHCAPVAKVGRAGHCRGRFRVVRGGATARFVLTSRAETVRNSPASIEYHVYARTSDRVAGVPRSVSGFAGFLQGERP